MRILSDFLHTLSCTKKMAKNLVSHAVSPMKISESWRVYRTNVDGGLQLKV